MKSLVYASPVDSDGRKGLPSAGANWEMPGVFANVRHSSAGGGRSVSSLVGALRAVFVIPQENHVCTIF
ncbi:hypothetical protein TNCV_3602141 [Trichonephila clavipes]|nr:hypothetical protein TNCV_3602141 [Trichonephila clavipes]